MPAVCANWRNRTALPVRLLPTWKVFMGVALVPARKVAFATGLGARPAWNATAEMVVKPSMLIGSS